MTKNNNSHCRFGGWLRQLAAGLLSLPLAFQAVADGTETLGPPSIAIAEGTGIVAAGTGLISQPDTIDITVPAGASVKQVLLYWEGQMGSDVVGDDTITVNGGSVTGALIGGQTFFFGGAYSSAYRADITGLGLISPGANTLTVGGLDFTKANNGAGVLVVFDDGSATTDIQLRDGLDLAYIGFSGVRKNTVPQTFNFAGAPVDRVANLAMFFSSVSGQVSGSDADRPSSIEVTVGGTTQVFSNLLASIDGEEWDTLNLLVNIPAGATSMTVQAFSRDDLATGNNPASFAWTAAGLSVPPAALASLGDRVWEDRNANGVQDCADTNTNGVIGDTGDLGPECDAGIADVPVTLLAGNCETPLGQMVMTDVNGFYLFPNLEPGDYCVAFGKPPTDFCDTDGFDLGEPQFTEQSAGSDAAVDSNPDTDTGVTDPVNLASGQTNLTIDAGIYCPAKIGDRVWRDDNEDGLQSPGEEGVPDVVVKLYECTDGQAVIDDNKLVRTTTTDGSVGDMNYMFGAEPGFDLPPGEYFVQFMKPDGTQFTTPNVDGDVFNSDCQAPDGTTACTTLGSRGINLNRDCGLIPPPVANCDLLLDKTCRVETPPVSGDLACEAKIAASVLEYTGPGTPSAVTVTGKNKKAQVVSSFDSATGLLTVDARPEDLGAKMTITTDGVEEVIHTSCSAPYVAGQPAPLDSPKGAPSANWTVVSFVDKEGNSVALPGDSGDVYADNCTVKQPVQPSCETLGKPHTLTFKYTGGGCPGANTQGSKASCSGTVDDAQAVTVTVDAGDGYTATPTVVMPGETFTVARGGENFKSNTEIGLSNAGGTQQNEVHTSCSAPLAVGDEFGGMTLVAMNGQSGGVDVTYRYVVTNNGDPLTGVLVTDDPLGDIGGPIDMATGQTETFFKSVRITGTTVNTGMAVGQLSGGAECPAADSTTVTVEKKPPVTGGECDGKVTDLVLKNLGASAQIRVDQKKGGTVFDDVVPAGGEFGFSGTDKKDTLGTEISIYVDGVLNTKIHTSCSQPIGPGLISGSFEVISGNSRNGGPLPPL